ncbi:hypothetical protein ISU07_15095 [Nocardioides islandensis]|uniref:Uncharacterized protein n=1 Tax=Nocardioides islandensis TaxID=433663 RepID=A0A930YF58_9ACTN|nr:hypothetical protein [Nocardioides islandensis]MBF4764458.1 hypothetical protein [Nocardioides islandensis]
MNQASSPFLSLVVAVAMLLGGLGAAFAFDRAAHPASTSAGVTAPVATASGSARRNPETDGRRVQVRWAPCRAGSRLEAGVCVTEVVRTVTRPVSPVPVTAPRTAPRPAASPRYGEEGRSEHEDGEGREGRGDD